MLGQELMCEYALQTLEALPVFLGGVCVGFEGFVCFCCCFSSCFLFLQMGTQESQLIVSILVSKRMMFVSVQVCFGSFGSFPFTLCCYRYLAILYLYARPPIRR